MAIEIMRWDDMVITIAYFSIPLQILVAMVQYPRLQSMPWHLMLLAILFALFIFLCGTGHLFRCMGKTSGLAFEALNFATAIISLMTALYLLPLVPFLFEALDKTLLAEKQAKKKVLTFMSFLCHEIRNPLFAITSTIAFLRDDEDLSGEQRESIECINQSANLMLRLVNDVLDISKLESGKLKLEEKTFDLIQILEGAVSSTRLGAAKKVDFEFEVGSRVPRFVVGDSVRVLQMALNLLSNSAKFTEEGFIKFSVETIPVCKALKLGWIDVDDATHGHIRAQCIEMSCDESLMTEPSIDGFSSIERGQSNSIEMGLLDAEEGIYTSDLKTVIVKLEVEDSGVGISPERQLHVFQPYSQAKLSDFRQHGGTGLGLSIVARLAKIMGGSIHLKSELHQGSIFTIYIPMRIAPIDTRVIVSEGKSDENSVAGKKDVSASKSLECASMRTNETTESSAEYDPDYRKSSTEIKLFHSSGMNEGTGGDNGTARDLATMNATKVSSIKKLSNVQRSLLMTSPKFIPFDFSCVNNKTILVVDDNAINRKILSRMLKLLKLNYAEAVNGQEAVDFMKSSRSYTHKSDSVDVGLVLMDWSMPVMDGYDATKAIRSMGLDVPIVALTACALEEGLQELTKAGSNEIATKPILREELNRICQKYLVEWDSTRSDCFI